MKILLLGDFSSLYANLRDGLRQLGHHVVVASSGDSWKSTPRDIDLRFDSKGIFPGVRKGLSPVLNIHKLSGFDVVQYINPFYFHSRGLPNRTIIRMLTWRNDKFFLSAAGDDSYFWRNGRARLSYGPFDDCLKYDLKASSCYLETERSFRFNEWLVDKSHGVIPIAYEYEKSYEGCGNLLCTIPIPINVEKIQYRENKLRDKIVVFHGLNRYGFKGTRHVEKAFRILNERYPNDLSLNIEGKLPLDKYLELMAKTNVVVDQTNSYSVGLNGLYAMAMGKVVLGGAEVESLRALKIDRTPVINVLPSARNIVERIEWLLDHRAMIPEVGYESRAFVDKHHNYVAVADRYVSAWRDSDNKSKAM